MTEHVPELKEEIKRLTERLKVSNREKANLQMAVDLINGISGVAGLTNVVDHILQILVSAIGGSNIAIYYEAEGKWHYTDILGNNSRLDTIDDDLVKQSVEQKKFLKAKETNESKLTVPGFPLTYETWVYPLSVHDSFFGAIRLQGMAFEHAHYRANIDPFIQYSALILYHEVSNVRRLKSAYTKVNKAREKLQETNQLLNSVIENSPQAIIAFDLNKKITLWSTPAVNMFEWKTIEAVGNPFETIFSQQNRDIQNTFKDVLSGKRVLDIEIICLKKDDSTFDASLSVSPISDVTGKIHGGMAIVADISWRKKMESQVQQTQKMEAIGTLAGGIAHDFNNILFPIVGYAEMLLEDVSEDSPLRDSLSSIHSGSLRARDLVQQILAFSRHGKSELKLMQMQPIIKEALKLIRATIPTTISIKQSLQSDCGAVSANPTQIHQIIMNLTTNAYHAMEENGGELKINLKEIKLGEYDLINPDMAAGSYACLTIADTGVGMDKDITQKIFDPFFTTKKKGKETGMGLSVVHGIVKTMNGSIQVYSEPGKGTEFNVYLPVVKTNSVNEKDQPNKPIQEGIERILIVDDEESIITMEQLALKRLGYQVTSCISSIEALETFRADPDKFDIVISDMAMPNMPGDKLAVELIKIRPDIPILLCTGFSEAMTKEKIESIGVKDLLLKPIVIKDLAQKIREVLDK